MKWNDSIRFGLRIKWFLKKLPSICLPVGIEVAADDNAETLPNADEFVSADDVNCGNEAAEM